jgi:hypothetical protein
VVSIEERLRTLEEEVAFLKQQVSAAAQNGKWWERVCDSMRDFPEFEQVLRLGREYRQRQRHSDEDDGNAEP